MAIKAVSLESKATCVSTYDSAIDKETSDFNGYWEAVGKDPNSWRDFLKFKTGEQPTVFHIGVVDSEELNRIEDDCKLSLSDLVLRSDNAKHSEAMWRCFVNGLRDIENWGSEEEIPKLNRHGVSYVDPAWIVRNFIKENRKIGIDVGNRVWTFNQLSGDDVGK